MARILAPLLLLIGALLLAVVAAGVRPGLAQDAAADAAKGAQSVAEISAETPDDEGFLTRLLEKHLSGEGRTVTIRGFHGALSSRATFDSLTIADEDGPWLEIDDGAIQWTRSALLLRRIDINELSAREIRLPRLPKAEAGTATPETTSFSLPELPVAVNIQGIDADRVAVGEAVFGQQVAVEVKGALELAGGAGKATLDIRRVDGRRGIFEVDAAYANATQALSIDTTLDEAPDGIFVNLVGLNGKPSVAAEIRGDGPLDDFAAEIRLATDGQPRVAGHVAMKAATGPDDQPGRNFSAELSGDVAALVAEDQQAFFGSDVRLAVQGWRGDDGRISLPVLELTSDALKLTGNLETNSRGAPDSASLLLTLGRDAGVETLPVRLPMKGDPPVTVEGGRLQFAYDSAKGDGWTLSGNLDGFDRDRLQIARVTLDGRGEIRRRADGALAAAGGRIELGTDDIRSDDAALAAAIGPQLQGSADFEWSRGNVLEITALDIDGRDYGLSGDLRIDGIGSGITLSGRVKARHRQLADLAGVAQRPLEGAISATVAGHYTVLTRGFHVEAEADATDLQLGQEQVDRLLRGDSTLTLAAQRDDEGITLHDLTLRGERLTAQAAGTISSAASDVTATVSLASLAAADPALGGSLDAKATLTGPGGARRLAVDGQAVDLATGIALLDRALQGRTDLAIRASERDKGYGIDRFHLANPQGWIDGEGDLTPGATDARLAFELPDLGALAPGWSGSLAATGRLGEAEGRRSLTLDGKGHDLRFGDLDPEAAPTGTTVLALSATQGPEGIVISRGVLRNEQADIDVQGHVSAQSTDLAGHAKVATLETLGRGWRGALDLAGSFRDAGEGVRRLAVTGSVQDVAIGQQQIDGLLRGTGTVTLAASERDGTFTIDEARVVNPQLQAEASGTVGGGATDARAHLELASLAPLGPGWHGSLGLDATLRQSGGGPRAFTATGTGTDLSFGQTQVDAALAGETRFDIAGSEDHGVVTLERAQVDNPRLEAQAQGRVGGGVTDIAGQLRADSLAFLGRGFGGALEASGSARQQGRTLAVKATGSGRGLSIGNAAADTLLRGETRLALDATRTGTQIDIGSLSVSNPQLRIDAHGPLSSGVALDARLADLGLLTPGLQGPAEARGTVRRSGSTIGLDLALSAPGPTRASVSGTLAGNGAQADLRITGSSDAAIANPFLRTRSVEGPIDIDLRLNGRPSLAALSGRVSLNGGRLSDPKLGLGVEDLRIAADIAGETISIDGSGRPSDGGALSARGRISLGGAQAVDLDVRLADAVLSDPNLYRTSADGAVSVSGSISSGLQIAGRIALGRTEIRIPSTGLGGARDIPKITHLGERPPVRATRARAGLIPYPSAESSAAGVAGPPATPPAHPARLDLRIDAPNQIFVRGRGLDAELGGTMRITGTTANVVPIGFLQLIRGRLDLLGKRFDLTEGLLEMQGSLVPVIRFAAETSQDGISTRIAIEGEASDPKVTFSSTPEMPQEEVLSHLLFGRGMEHMSALQAVQLANAVATLAGKSGAGIIGNLRSGIGLDDLDLATDEEGNVSVQAGKYLTDRVYTDVAVSGDGTTRIDLNFDLTRSLTVRGSVANDGDSSVGLFFERDY